MSSDHIAFTEHRIPRGEGSLYARDYAGTGPAFVLMHGFPDSVDPAIMLNSAYTEDATVLWPEMITLFATGSMQSLAIAIAQSPEQFGCLLKWQQKKLLDPLPEAQKPHFSTFTGPLISDN